MTNPFETINERLLNIETLLLEIKHKPVEVENPENLTVKETADVLKVSEQSVHNYIKKGLIPGYFGSICATDFGRLVPVVSV